MSASGVGVWGRGGGSRWCLQSVQHLLPVLTHPSGGRFPGCQRAAADRRCFGPTACFYAPPLHGASEGQLLRARKDVSGGGGGQGVGKEGCEEGGEAACLPQEVSVPVLQLYPLIITSCSGGDRVASSVCPLEPRRDPCAHLQRPSLLHLPSGSMWGKFPLPFLRTFDEHLRNISTVKMTVNLEKH